MHRGPHQRMRWNLCEQHRSRLEPAHPTKYISGDEGLGIGAVITAIRGKNLDKVIPSHM